LAPLVLAWGFNYLFVNVGLGFASPLWLAFLRAGVGCAGTAALVLVLRPAPYLDARGRRDALLLGLPNTGFFFALWFVAAERVPPGLAAVFVYTFPLWVALLSAPLLGHQLSRLHWVSVVVGFVGVAVIAQVWSLLATSVDPLSVVLLLFGALSWALGTVLFQRRFAGEHAVEGNAWGLLGGAAFLAVATLVIEPTPIPRFGAPPLWAAIVWLGLVGTACAYSIWYSLLGRFRAATLSAYVVLVPVVALAASAVFFTERLDALQLVGVGLVLVSILGISRAGAAELPPRSARGNA